MPPMVTAKAALAALATLVALALALSTFERWLVRRRRHELAWTASLTMFAVASAALWVGVSTGWTEPAFRVFYLFGAILNVPFLALGTVYLLAGPRRGDAWAAVVVVVGAFSAGIVTVAPLHGHLSGELPSGKEVFDPLPRILAAVASGVGATVVIVGAVISAWRLLRGQRRSAAAPAVGAIGPRRLAIGNVLIALGTVVLSLSGILSGRLGKAESFGITLAIGIVILFTGFLVATGPATPAQNQRASESYELSSETTSTIASATRTTSASSIT
ncbi:MAG: hypothetical protein JWL70_2145 [Acidimicrobiia bacterium]|nr:hypothetical protein [Acidimicrobiia bacterium]